MTKFAITIYLENGEKEHFDFNNYKETQNAINELNKNKEVYQVYKIEKDELKEINF